MRFTLGLPIRRADDAAFGDASLTREIIAFAEEMGFWGITAPDHIVSPNAWAAAGGGETWIDPFVLLSYAAAMTQRIRLITHIIVLPYRSPFEVAKALASLDHISNGRAVLGAGSGYLKEEFAILNVPFEERGARTDEALDIITACWEPYGEDIEFEGRFWSIGDAKMGPLPVQQPRPPIWIGGNSMRAVRRTVERGDCWAPFDVRDDDVRAGIARAKELGKKIEIALPLGRVQKDEGKGVWGGATEVRIGELTRLGAHYIKCGFGGATPREWFENAEWFARDVMPGFA